MKAEVKAAIELLTKEFSVSEREIVPRYPYVLVRRIPRETRTKSNIILTDQQGKSAGKPVGEGIVIRVWEHKDEQRDTELQVGDQVIFPHYAGYPADGNADGENNLWLIPDISSSDITAVGVLGHFRENSKVEEVLARFICEHSPEDYASKESAKKLLQDYDLIPKKVEPRTRLG